MSVNEKIKLIATDLDGTLLRDDKTISEKDLESLNLLAEKNVFRVAATGRSMHKVFEVLPIDTPFDFIVFSSGAGIYDWKKHKLLVSEHFENDIIDVVSKFLIRKKLNFIVFRPIPENNLFQFHRGAGFCSEFDNYLARHKGDFSVLDENKSPSSAGQFMAIIPNDESFFEMIKNEMSNECDGIKVIRTTSPVDTRFIWLEIFPDTVSKGHGIKWLCDFLDIPYQNTVGIGNDYNDQDMLEFVGKPYLLGNSPSVLKNNLPFVSETNNQSGFSKVLSLLEF